MTTKNLIYVTLATSFVASIAALYIGYLFAQKQLNATVAANPLLKLFGA